MANILARGAVAAAFSVAGYFGLVFAQPIAAVAQHYQLKDPEDLTDGEFEALLEKEAASKPGGWPAVPWDFRPSGTTKFDKGLSGLSAAAREKLARSMNGFASLEPPYKSLYCYRELFIVGRGKSDPRQEALTKKRVDSVARWLIEHGYDPSLIYTDVSTGGLSQEVEWEIVGGIGTRRQCEKWREEWRTSVREAKG